MEAEIIKALSTSSGVTLTVLLGAGQLFGIIIIVFFYRLIHRFVPEFLVIQKEMSENTHLMREMLNDVRRDVDDLKDDLQDVKNITAKSQNSGVQGTTEKGLRQRTGRYPCHFHHGERS